MNHIKFFVLFLINVWMTGCVVGPDFQTPAAPNTTRYTEKRLPTQTTNSSGDAGKAQHFQTGQDISAQWWTLFHSKALNALIIQGLANSPTLDAAQAALQQAQENLRANIGAGLFPSISAQLAATRERDTNATFGNPGGDVFNVYNASVNASYTLDIFGGTRRQIEQLRAAVDYQRFQWEAAYLTLTTNIVTTAIAEASLRAQINATEELIRSQENELKIVRQQFQLGGVSQTDVLSQQTLLAQTRATLPPLEKSLGQFRNSLAVLIGSLPSETQLPVFHLADLNLPYQLPVSLPSRLVQQRPDVRAAEALLHQASAGIGVATANRFPQIALTSSYGYSSNQTRTLFDSNSSFWSLGSQLTQTIFDAGALKAKQNAATAAYNQRAAEYRQTVLKAFQDVADTLHAIEIDAHALKTQAEAEKAAHASLMLVQQQYKLGAVSYLARLDAERAYEQTRIARIQAQAARYADTAALFQALGGGWWNRGRSIN